MAFLNVVPLTASRTQQFASTCTRPRTVMSVGNGLVSRRQALGLAVVFGVGLLGMDAAKAENEDLKEELGTIEYDEALTEVGPAAAELNVREKKLEETPEYVEAQKEIEAESERKFETMVKSEADQAAAIRAKFGKMKK